MVKLADENNPCLTSPFPILPFLGCTAPQVHLQMRCLISANSSLSVRKMNRRRNPHVGYFSNSTRTSCHFPMLANLITALGAGERDKEMCCRRCRCRIQHSRTIKLTYFSGKLIFANFLCHRARTRPAGPSSFRLRVFLIPNCALKESWQHRGRGKNYLPTDAGRAGLLN